VPRHESLLATRHSPLATRPSPLAYRANDRAGHPPRGVLTLSNWTKCAVKEVGPDRHGEPTQRCAESGVLSVLALSNWTKCAVKEV
jgi:hypothetical protein